MTDFEKIEHLYQGHNCINCGTVCNKCDGVCNRWTKQIQEQGHFHNIAFPTTSPTINDSSISFIKTVLADYKKWNS